MRWSVVFQKIGKIGRSKVVKSFEDQYKKFEFDSLRDREPMKGGEEGRDVIIFFLF